MIITGRVISGDGVLKMNHDHDRGKESVRVDHLDIAMNFRGSRVDDLHDADSRGGDRGRRDDDHDVARHDGVARGHATRKNGDAPGERNHDRPSGFCRMSGPDHFQWQDGADGCLLLGGRRLPVCWRQKNK